MLALGNPLKYIEILVKLKEFEIFVELKINEQKKKILTKNMNSQKEFKLINKTGYKVKKVKYMGIILTNTNGILYYSKVWTEIKKDLARWEEFKLLLGRILGLIKKCYQKYQNFFFRLFQFRYQRHYVRNWEKNVSRFVRQGKKARVKFKILQNVKDNKDMG